MQTVNSYARKRPSLLGRLNSLRLWFLLGILLLSLLISGCVHSDLDIHYRGQTGGEIIQRIQLAEQLTTVNRATTQEWFTQVERRARQLQGRSKRVSPQEIQVTIPFANAADLETKLNQFLSTPQTPKATPAVTTPWTLAQSHLKMQQQNFLVLLRSHLTYDLDLRSLGLQSSAGNLLLSPNTSLLELQFSLETPWGARSLKATQSDDQIVPPVQQQGKSLVWTLQPGQMNHIEAFFWYPSPIGLGGIAIVLLVIAGRYLKYGTPQATPEPVAVSPNQTR